jgi:hypothetical protein
LTSSVWQCTLQRIEQRGRVHSSVWYLCVVPQFPYHSSVWYLCVVPLPQFSLVLVRGSPATVQFGTCAWFSSSPATVQFGTCAWFPCHSSVWYLCVVLQFPLPQFNLVLVRGSPATVQFGTCAWFPCHSLVWYLCVVPLATVQFGTCA